MCSRLLGLGVALVALERPDGLLIERLLDAGLTVVAVHPNQVKAMRPRYSVAGGKSDSFDSFVLAELARTDRHRFRVLEPDSDQTKALRSMTRARMGSSAPGRSGTPSCTVMKCPSSCGSTKDSLNSTASTTGSFLRCATSSQPEPGTRCLDCAGRIA